MFASAVVVFYLASILECVFYFASLVYVSSKVLPLYPIIQNIPLYMLSFDIVVPDEGIIPQIQHKINCLTKSKGCYGLLEKLALQIGCVQQTTSPSLYKPVHIVFTADHGIAEEGVSSSPQEITKQMVSDFLDGGTELNFLVYKYGFDLKIVDAGVNNDFDLLDDRITHRKIRKGTRNYLHQAAMFLDEFDKAIEVGAEIVQQSFKEGSNIISFDAKGIANTSSSAIWMNTFTGILLRDCLGIKSDHKSEFLEHKYKILRQATDRYEGDGTTVDVMRHFGGFEMVMAVGGILKAAELGMTILVEGFVMSTCVLAAARINKNVLHYLIFGHPGDDAVHKDLLEFLKVEPVLNLGLSLGEETGGGTPCVYSIVDFVVQMLNEMNSVEDMGIVKYFDVDSLV